MSSELVLTTDLRMLTYSTLLCLMLWIPYILAGIGVRGLVRMTGNPQGDYADLPQWAQRTHRAHMNLVENLAPFAALVLVAHLSGTANEITALGARLFFWARVVHAGVYMAGIPWVRTLSFAAGWAGNLIILVQILR